jgi:hypothetical protein
MSWANNLNVTAIEAREIVTASQLTALHFTHVVRIHMTLAMETLFLQVYISDHTPYYVHYPRTPPPSYYIVFKGSFGSYFQ